MRLKHPLSFFLLIVVITITSALSVSWGAIPVTGLLIDILLLITLRLVALREGKARKEMRI